MRVRFVFFLAILLGSGSLLSGAAIQQVRAADPRLVPLSAPPEKPLRQRQPAVAPGVAAPAAASKPARRFKSLDEAVSAGRLDASVLAALRKAGRAEATIAFDSSDIAAEAAITTPPGKDNLKLRIRASDKGLAKQRDRVLRGAGNGIAVSHAFDHLDVVDVTITSARALLKIANHPEVEGIVGMHVSAPSLAESLAIIGQPAVKAQGHQGQGTYVAVLDTGVNYPLYPAFFPAGSVAFEKDMTTNDDGSKDNHGHGTHVASTVLGVAPMTKILAYDVFELFNTGCGTDPPPCNRSPPYAQQAAINDVLAKKANGWNIVAINMSLGGGWSDTGCADTLGFGSLRNVGILPVVASGNFFHVDENGFSVAKTGISSPACIPAAVAVGATTDDSSRSASWSSAACDQSLAADSIAVFSQTTSATDATYGPQLDILAPGSCILAAGGYKQGTSMAAPHVAGAIAVLKEWSFPATAAGALNEEAFLEYYGKPISDTRTGAPQITRPRLDIGATVRALQGTADTTPPVVSSISTDIVAGSQLSTTGGVVTRLRWSATDASGIKAYTLWWRVDGGTWNRQTLPSPLTSTWDYLLAPNQKWEFAVNATDGRDNVSAFQFSLPTRFTLFQENQFVTYDPIANWTRTARSDCLGGFMEYAAVNGSTATFTFTHARQVAWITTTNVDRGWVYRWFDDRTVGWIDLYGGTLSRRVAIATFNVGDYLSNHTVKLWVDGTVGRPNADIDAFVLMQNE